MLSVNKEALKILEDVLKGPEAFGARVETYPSGTTIIDTGLEVEGSYQLGLKITEIAMGGLGAASLTFMSYGDFTLPTVVVTTDHPSISLFGCQLAGWKIKVGEYVADASGPGRALSLKPKRIFEKIGYRDEFDSAVLLIETSRKPTDDVALEISKACNVNPRNLYLILTSIASIAGYVQISGRIIETALFRLDYLGFDPLKALHGTGYAPVMPFHSEWGKAMGRCEDALTYGGYAHFIVNFENDEKLKELVGKAPSCKSKAYGRTCYDIYKEVNFDFTKVDTNIFAPAMISVTNKKTGKTFTSGSINVGMLKNSMSL